MTLTRCRECDVWMIDENKFDAVAYRCAYRRFVTEEAHKVSQSVTVSHSQSQSAQWTQLSLVHSAGLVVVHRLPSGGVKRLVQVSCNWCSSGYQHRFDSPGLSCGRRVYFSTQCCTYCELCRLSKSHRDRGDAEDGRLSLLFLLMLVPVYLTFAARRTAYFRCDTAAGCRSQRKHVL